VTDLVQQIDRSLQFFFAASSQHGKVDQLIFAGGCALIPGADAAIQERLHIPTVVARPFAQMAVAARARPQQLAQDEATLLIAAGLAWRAFDETA
ncbi:MAG: pilus assembly protein PilM, partial [Nevskia sp.]|nr:pilus assembly protein PilM [Nevskia sp.]